MARLRSTAPYWLKAIYGGICSRCQGPVKKGEDILYFPQTKRLLCAGDSCGRQHQRDMDANAFDEAMYNYQGDGR